MFGIPESMALGGKVRMSCIWMRKYLYLGPKVPGTHRILILRLKSPHISRAGIDESSSHQIDAQKTSFLPPTHLLILPPLRRHQLKIAGEDASPVRLGSPGGFPDPAIVEAQSLFPAFSYPNLGFAVERYPNLEIFWLAFRTPHFQNPVSAS